MCQKGSLLSLNSSYTDAKKGYFNEVRREAVSAERRHLEV